MAKKVSPIDRVKILSLLQEKGVNLPCPRCGGKEFIIMDDYGGIAFQKRVPEFTIGGSWLPFVIVGCKNCGYLSFHAIGSLGLIEDEEDSDGQG